MVLPVGTAQERHCLRLLLEPGRTNSTQVETVLNNIPDPLHSPVAEGVYAATDISDRKSAVPLYIYNGAQEFWIPSAGAQDLFRRQCAFGTPAAYRSVPGEHFISGFTGWPELLTWLDQRLQGVPAPDEC